VKLEFNESPTILAIAEHVLAGDIASSLGNHADAIAHLRKAAEVEDALAYGEPPDWTVPVRHDLGAVLLAAGRPVEAERIYREDLQRFPSNGWSLTGLSQALREQGRTEEAERVTTELRRAWSAADIAITSSHF
jgi:Flp pilus assembly protein TadD